MTKTFRWFIVFVLLFIFGGIYTGDKIFFIALGVSLSILFYSLLTNLWVLLDFNYIQIVTPPQATKGNTAILEIEIHNDKFFIFPFIKVYYQTPDSGIIGYLEESTCAILPLSKHLIVENIHCNVRGHFPLGIVRIEVGDLFGLFNFSMDLTKQSYHRPLFLDVWPRVLNLTYLPVPQIDHEGNLSTNMMRTQEFSNISDIREYAYGDPFKKIHWKSSSKLQEIMVKNYETDTQPHIMLFIETSHYPRDNMINYQIEDQILESTTAIVYYLLSKSIPIQLIAYTNIRQNVHGQSLQDFDNLYGFLAHTVFQSPFSMSHILRMEYNTFLRGSGIFLIVQHISAEIFNTLFLIKDSGVSISIFYIKDQTEDNGEDKQIIHELNEKGIHTIVVQTDRLLNKILEAI
ncbi:MAG TPA: DUF58 domain-containing protein [Clostridia bacterium]|nr:DUF58 domain-containing protein [Clostridia bacterium]